MKKNVQRILATILTVIMMISMLPSNVFAADFDADMFVEPAVEAVSVPAEEQEVESTVEYIYEEPAETLQGSSDEIQTVEAADPAADEIEEETEAPVVDETVTLKAEGSDYIVTLTYDASAGLPAGADIKVKELTENNRKYDDYVEQAANTIDSDVEALNYVRLFDISIVDKAGNPVEPTGQVDVKIDLKDVEQVEETTQVVHFAGEDEVPEVVDTTVSEGGIAFATDGFSIYAVLNTGEEDDNARLKVIFMNGETEFKSMYVKKADVTNGKLNEVLYDPGEPESADGKTFLGWTDQASYTMDTDRMTIDEVRTAVSTMLNNGVKEGDSVTYYAVMFKAISLYYQDRYENTYRTESLLTTGNDATTTVDQEYTMQGANPSEGFVGWVVKGTEETEGHTVYQNGEPITISQDTTLIPEIGQGTWLFFDSNAGGAGVSEASYTAPKFIPVGDTPAKPADPTRPGYTFAGWFEGPEDSAAAFDFNKQMSEHTAAADGYVYAYAHWTPNPTGSYKVVIWAQKVTDDKNAADSAKTYDYVATYTINDAVAGTALTKEELGKSSNNYFTKDNAFFGATDLQHGSKAFVYRTFTVDHGIGADGNGVSPDDSTVVNVYYDRALFTIYFTGEPGGETIEYYVPVDDGENVYGLVGGEYVKLTSEVSNKRIVWSKRAGTLDLPSSSLTQVKYGSATYVYDDTVDVSILQKVGGGKKLIDLDVGETGYQAFISGHGGNRYLYTTNSTSNGYCQLQWTIAADYSYTTPDGTTYTEQVYKKESATGLPYSGLYGQTLSQNGYEWITPSSAQSWNQLSWLEAFRSDLFGADGLGGIPNAIIAEPETHNTNTTIIFYFEDANNAGQYREVDRVDYYFQQGTNAQYNITERLLGGDFNGYKWSTSEALPSSWEYGIDSSGFTTTKRGNNTYIHIRYKRATYKIVYMQGNATLKTVSDVPYEASLANYAGTVPADSAVTVGENEFFRGWFEDPEGVRRVDWTGKMPAGNKTIYAVVAKAQYHVVIDMDGGTLPNNQSTEFWEDAGNIIDDTNFKSATKTDDQGNVYTLVGYFTDENYSKQWNFSARLNEEDLWHKYDDTNGDDPYRDSNFFEKGNDVGWYNVSGIFRLFAQWKNDDILSKGGLHIRYKNPDGTVVSTDSMHYADQVDVRAADAPAASFVPEDKRFDGWQLKEGKVYQPTEIFVADSEDAVIENDEYWITLTAVYVDKEDKTPTHIYFYKNDGTTTEPILKYDDVDINVGYDICTAPTREGYTFLGWARDIETPVDGDGNPEIDPETGDPIVNTSSAKTEADFLEYKDGKYYLPNSTTVVTQVAADEVLPYHGLYAIWEKDVFYIYHSSIDEKEPVDMPKSGDTFDLTRKVKEGYLYGGYFHYEEGSKGTAYNESGLTLSPVKGTTYYLKEVEDTYLVPRIFITYDANEGHDPKYALRQLWAIMDLDASCVDGDGNAYGEYGGYGFIVGDNIQSTTLAKFICENLEVKYPDKDKPDTYTMSSLYGDIQGRLAVSDLTANYLTDTTASEFKLRAYFKTPDGVIVTGKKQRIVHMGDRVFASKSWNKTDWEEGENGIWQETPKDDAGNYTPGSEAVAATSRSLGASTTIPSVRTYQIKSAPDILTYTVTKVDDGKNESQVVQAGDNTGKITYAGKTGYVFAGWYLDKAYTKAADFSVVTGDMTVYAKYVKATAIGLSFTKKSSKSGSVTLNATLKITGAPDLADAAVSCDYKGKTSTVKFTGAKTTKSGKTTVSTYTGTVAISGLANKSSFKAAISYKTPDGTYVSLADKTCKYTSGKVTVK